MQKKTMKLMKSKESITKKLKKQTKRSRETLSIKESKDIQIKKQKCFTSSDINIKIKNNQIMSINKFFNLSMRNINYYNQKPHICIYNDISVFKFDNIPFIKTSHSSHQWCKLSFYKKYFKYLINLMKQHQIEMDLIDKFTNITQKAMEEGKKDEEKFLEIMNHVFLNNKIITRKITKENITRLSCVNPLKLPQNDIIVFDSLQTWTENSLELYLSRQFRIFNSHMDPPLLKILSEDEDEFGSVFYLCEFGGMFEHSSESKQFWVQKSLLILNFHYTKVIEQYKTSKKTKLRCNY